MYVFPGAAEETSLGALTLVSLSMVSLQRSLVQQITKTMRSWALQFQTICRLGNPDADLFVVCQHDKI